MVAKVAQVIGLAVILQFLMFQANLLVSDATVLVPEKLVYRAGDEMAWKDKDWDDSTWTETQPEAGERWWLRATFEWDEQAIGGGLQKELVVMLPASYELYWNGILVNVNGTADRPGELDRKLMLPDSLISSGRHVLAIRVISHPDLGRALPVELAIDDYNAFFQRAVIKNILLFSLAGIFFITAIYYFFLFFISHKKSGIWEFSLLCFFLFLLILETYSRYFYSYDYTQYRAWLLGSRLLALVVALVLPVFLINNFSLPRRKLLRVIASLVVLASFFLPDKETSTLFFSALFSLGITIAAIARNRLGSWEALVGLIVFFSGMVYFNISIFFAFAALVTANLFSLAIIQRRERQAYEQSLLRSSRLELELLKKNIRPHFLMNTLTNIISLIEEQPQTSIRLIEALSDEFYAMNEISDKRLIPLDQELQLCRSYLEVMRIRHDVAYPFNIRIAAEDIQLPPALIHTLIENGVTHSEPCEGKVAFLLEAQKEGSTTTLGLQVWGRFDLKPQRQEGTGIKYIKSRLEESFSNGWTFEQQASDTTTWQTRITFTV